METYKVFYCYFNSGNAYIIRSMEVFAYNFQDARQVAEDHLKDQMWKYGWKSLVITHVRREANAEGPAEAE